MYDVLIIGAGMSGLAAGIRLAQFGVRVAILERHTTIGGLNSFYRLDGRNYDVGLHAVTNFQPKGAKHGPLPRCCGSSDLSWDQFELVPQTTSAVAFPGVRLEFSNDFALLESEVARRVSRPDRQLPPPRRRADPLRRIRLPSFRCFSALQYSASSISDPLLAEMLLCPLLYYGSARERDTDFGQASVMFRSIFLEGFARPSSGVRVILKVLTRRFKELGGELLLRAGVRRIVAAGDEAHHLELDDGSELSARSILSSAGWNETMRLCEGGPEPIDHTPPGELSFVESIAMLDRPPAELGYTHAILFFNDSEKFHWEKPRDRLTDVRSGVVCSPNNFAYDADDSGPEPAIRMTALANYDRWHALPKDVYQREKAAAREAIYESAVRFVPDFRPHIVATDTFTPTTIRHYTGHDNGAVYGAPSSAPTEPRTSRTCSSAARTKAGWASSAPWFPA